MLTELLDELRQEKETLARQQATAFTLGLVARTAWSVTKWVSLFFLIGALMILKTIFYMALGGKGWR